LSIEQGKLRVRWLFNAYSQAHNAEGIASILKEIPRDSEFADILCDGFVKLQAIDRSFFSRSNRFFIKNIFFLATNNLHLFSTVYNDVTSFTCRFSLDY